MTRVLSSHCHPDHIGLAGWLCGRLDLGLYASQTEYLEALTVRLDPGALNAEPYRGFYLSHGLGETQTEVLLNRGLHYLRMVSELPRTFNRLMADEPLEIGGRTFEVLTGGGHSSEQAMLYCREGGFVLCADQVMAKISPNISVEAMNPNGDPLGAYLRSLAALKQKLPPETLALPGHNLPFVGLHDAHRRVDRPSPGPLRRDPKAVQAGEAARWRWCRLFLAGRLTTRIRCRSHLGKPWRTSTISCGARNWRFGAARTAPGRLQAP